jgi:hypothetical protein
MPIIVNIGSWILRGLTAVGAYNVVDTITGESGNNPAPVTESNMASIGLAGILGGFLLYKALDKPKRKYRRY